MTSNQTNQNVVDIRGDNKGIVAINSTVFLDINFLDSRFFILKGTQNFNNITGDGTCFYISFDSNHPDVLNKAYTEPDQFINDLELSWYLEFEGVTDQEYGQVIIKTSNTLESYRYPKLKSLTDFHGRTILSGKLYTQLDPADIMLFGILMGTSTNPKTISIVRSASAYLKVKRIKL